MKRAKKIQAQLFFLILSAVMMPVSISNFALTRESPQGSGEKNFKRIICAAPSITEIVFSLGCEERVVGVSEFSTYPQEAKKKPKIGGLLNPSRERILALQPDLVIAQGKHEALKRLCMQNRIHFLSLRINTIEEILKAIQTTGELLGEREKAEELIRRLKDKLGFIKKKTERFPRKKVFLALGHLPGNLNGLMTADGSSFLNQVIELAGGENIFKESKGFYPLISKESLIRRQPQIIVEAFPGGISEKKKRLLLNDWEKLPMLPAVKLGNIYFLSDDFLLIPGIRVDQTVRRMAELLHPEAFNEKENT